MAGVGQGVYEMTTEAITNAVQSQSSDQSEVCYE